MPTTGVEVRVNSRWQALDGFYGDVEFATCWPGGSDSLTWTASGPQRRLLGALPVLGQFGPLPVFSGTLTEPDASQQQLTAQGLWRLGNNYAALDGSGNATATVDVAVDQAISRGLPWTRPTSISAVPVNLDVSSSPATVASLLDAWTLESGQRWGVDVNGRLFAKPDPTVPAYQTLPMAGGLGFALDDYASTLVGRYINVVGNVYATTSWTDAVAQLQHGHAETTVDLTGRGPITTAVAQGILATMLALGASTPQWTSTLTLTYGELLTPGGVPIALETVTAGQVVRVRGGYELAQRLNGAMYLDVLIGRTQLAGGKLTITPMQTAPRNFVDVIADALSTDDAPGLPSESSTPTPDNGLVNMVSLCSAGWAGYGSGYQDPAYRKIGNKVQMSGLIGRSISAAGPGNVILTMPAGFRPLAGILIFPVTILATGPVEKCGRIDLNSSGQMILQTDSVPVGGYVSVSSIQYDV